MEFSHIEFEGKSYLTRILPYHGVFLTLGTQELADVLMNEDGSEAINAEANAIDEKIYFYQSEQSLTTWSDHRITAYFDKDSPPYFTEKKGGK